MKKISKKILVLMMFLMLSLLMFGCGDSSEETAAETGGDPITVSFDVVVGGEVQTTVTDETNTDNLGEFLRESGIVEGKDSQYGMYIVTVDGVTADESKQEWWCVTKGGAAVQTGVDSTPIADGDKFELTFTEGY
ncbi:MAG: DUF4430 domain-containing protein [Bacillota bacterium]|jgi:hypothetical protein